MPDTDHKVYIGIVAILVESAAPVAVLGVALAAANLSLVTVPSFRGWIATGIIQIPFSVASVSGQLSKLHFQLNFPNRSSLRNLLCSVLIPGHLGPTRRTQAQCFPVQFSSMLRFKVDMMMKAAPRATSVHVKAGRPCRYTP